MNKAFKWCVKVLEDLAAWLGITYEEINIWIFVIIEPIVFLVLIWIIYRQYHTIQALKAAIRD